VKKIALITAILLGVLTVATSTIGAVDDLAGCADGASWTNNNGWGLADLCDSAWYGVTCEAGNVTTLILSDNLLSGPIPAVLGNLSNLGWLSLNNNQLSGPISAELFR
jgi:Leucine-rich repeat (LRR) protein